MQEPNSGKNKILEDALKTFQKSTEELANLKAGQIRAFGTFGGKIHEVKRRLEERAFYPEHDERKASREYTKVHKKLVEKEDKECLICGIRRSTLSTSENRFGAIQMETHHHAIEWALANAIDTEKFNKRLLPRLRSRHPDNPSYQKDFTTEQVRAWIDHDEDNLWVLCDVHHRAKFFGIHQITDPIWGPMDLLNDEFDDYVRQQIGSDTKSKKLSNKSSKKSVKKKNNLVRGFGA